MNFVRHHRLLDSVAVPNTAETVVLDVGGVTPSAALAKLRAELGHDPESREQWRKRARVASVLGSSPRSLASMRAGGFLDVVSM